MTITYFSYCVPISYRGKPAPNIINRAKLPDVILQNRRLFHPYQISDGDRPDTIAYFYYGSEFYDWIVLLSNNIIDPRSEWPLTNDEFNQYITDTYGSVQSAMQTIAYYQINSSLPTITATAFGSLPANVLKYYTVVGTNTYGIKQDQLRISVEGFSNLDPTELVFWTSVSQYDDEFAQNEAKRNIYLIDAARVSDIEQSLRQVFNG